VTILQLLLSGIVLLIAGYKLYGRYLSKLFGLDNRRATPAVRLRDNQDFIPTNRFYLLGQHLSAIAAAGPIVGPILAGVWFGWLPTALWIILGGIFIGGVHDMAAMVASLRHQGKSIAEIIHENMSRKAFTLFLAFLWFSIVYIVTAFTDITASTFIEPEHGAQVASSSLMYLGLALLMGLFLRRFKLPLVVSTLIFMPLVLVCIFLGPHFPVHLPPAFGLDNRVSWDILLLIYCFVASVIPVWLLLQPRGYLGGFFLSLTAGVSFIGLVIGALTQQYLLQYPAFVQWTTPQGLPLLPILFTTVACGACSGFHSIVSSGTTSKQIAREKDVRIVGYGGMLLESFVALIALATLVILSRADAQALQDPNRIFANGVALFLSNLGIAKDFAFNFALLAFATFVFDTLDVATRLGRYIFQEFCGLKGRAGAAIATIATLALPLLFIMRKVTSPDGANIPAWKLFWTVFGSSNQLLAAMTLLGLSIWLYRGKKKFLVTLLPAIFMSAVAIVSLLLLLKPWLTGVLLRGTFTFEPMVITGIVLLVLAFFLIVESVRILGHHVKN